MTRDTDVNTGKKLRAIVFAFIMVTSVVALGSFGTTVVTAADPGSVDEVQDGNGNDIAGNRIIIQAGTDDQSAESGANGAVSSVTLRENNPSQFPGSGTGQIQIAGTDSVTFNTSQSVLSVTGVNMGVSSPTFESDTQIRFDFSNGGANSEAITVSGIAYDGAPTTQDGQLEVTVGSETETVPINPVTLNSKLSTSPVNIVRGADGSGSANLAIEADSSADVGAVANNGIFGGDSRTNNFAASGTNITVSIDSRISQDLSFDQSADVQAAGSGTDLNGDGSTNDEDLSNVDPVEINENTLTFELGQDLQNNGEVELQNIAFNSTGISDDTVDPAIDQPLNISYTPAVASGEVTDQRTNNNVVANAPIVRFTDDGDGGAAANEGTNGLSPGTTGSSVQDANSNQVSLEIQDGVTNNEIGAGEVLVELPEDSGITFDTSQVVEIDYGGDDLNIEGQGTGNQVARSDQSGTSISVQSNQISFDVDKPRSGNDDVIHIGSDDGSNDDPTSAGVNLAVDPLQFNTSTDATGTDVNLTVTTSGGAADIVQNSSTGSDEANSFDLDVRGFEVFSNNQQNEQAVDAQGNNLTLGVDSDGETQVNPSNDNDVVLQSGIANDLLASQPKENITVSIPRTAPFAFDRSQDDNDGSVDIEVRVGAGNTGNNLPTAGNQFANLDNGDITDNEVTIVDEQTINVTFSESDFTVNQGDDIFLEGIQYNITGDSSGSNQLQVVTNVTGDVTVSSANFINVTLVEPDTLQSDADEGSSFGDSGDSQSITGLSVGDTQTSSLKLTNSSGVGDNALTNFGGGDVNLAVTDSPDKGSASDITLNTTTVVTANDGTTAYNVTVADGAAVGTYNVTASLASNASVNVTTQYNVGAGTASQFNVTGADNAVIDQSGLSESPSETEVAAFRVRIEDNGGNLVSGTDVDVSVQVENGELQQLNDQIAGDGSRGAGTTLSDSDGNGRLNYIASNDNNNQGEFFVFASSGSAGEMNVTVSEGGVSDTGTATVFNPDSVAVDPESSTITPGSLVNVTATVQTDDGATVEVPRLTVNDLSSDNTTVLRRTSISEENNGGTFANGTVEATFEAQNVRGSATVTADIAGVTGETTLTVQDEAPPTATVTFDDQSVDNGSTSVNVASARFDGTEDFVIVVHRASPGDNGVVDSTDEIGNKIGSSDVLSGNVSDVSVNLTKSLDEGGNTQLTEDQTLIAMLHFADESGGTNFGSPITRGGSPVFDQANITVTPESPLEGAAGDFDTDGDGDISIGELSDAGTAFARGELTIDELSAVGRAFAS